MRRFTALGGALLLLGLFSPAAASQIVQFRDGRYATILSHKVDGPWVRLDYGRGYVILSVDRILTIARGDGDAVVFRAPEPKAVRFADRVLRADPAPERHRVARAEWHPAIHWRSLPPLEVR